jgi:hypothetical protein
LSLQHQWHHSQRTSPIDEPWTTVSEH